MKKFKLETQLFCLYFTPIVIVIFLCIGFYVILLSQIKNILSDQEQQIYLEQQTSKKQILLGLKSHLDQSFSLLSQEYFALSRFTSKIFEHNIVLNDNFVASLLNLERFYLGEEDSAMINLYNKSQFLTSVWLDNDIKDFEDLASQSKDTLKKAAIVDILVRNFNILNVKRTFSYNHQLHFSKNQFTGFELDGSFIANPAYNQSMNESFQTESSCPGKLYYDSTCRIWYILASQKEGTIMPSPFKVLTTKIPYMSLSLCRKTNANGKIQSVACLSFEISQLAKVFSGMEIQTGAFNVIHSTNNSLIYQKSIQNYSEPYSWTSFTTENMTTNEKDVFLSKMESTLKVIQAENNNGVDIHEYNQLFNPSKISGFEFLEKSNEKYCLLLPIQIADKLNGEVDTSFSNIMILIYMFQRSEMIKGFSDVEYQMQTIFMISLVLCFLLLIFLLIIILYYAKKSAQLMELPISDLTQRLKMICRCFNYQGINSQEENDNIYFDKNFNNKKQNQSHTCYELIKLKEYINNIQQVFNFNVTFSNKISETDVLFSWVKAIKLFKPQNDCKALGSLFNNIANIHFNNNRFIEALDCYHQSLIYLENEQCEILQRQLELKKILRINFSNKDCHSTKLLSSSFSSLLDKQLQVKQKLSQQQLSIQSVQNQNITKRIIELKSLKFDRLFAYSQVLLACSLEGYIENTLLSSCDGLKTQTQDHFLLKILRQESLKDKLNNSDCNRAAHTKKQTKQALLKEHSSVLFKLKSIASELNNDEQRYILIFLELSQQMMLLQKYKKSKKYLLLAYNQFLILFKKQKLWNEALWQQHLEKDVNMSSQSSTIHFVNYVEYVKSALSRHFSLNELFDEPICMIRKKNITYPQYIKQSSLKESHQRTQTIQSLKSTTLPTIHPIIEDYMECVEENIMKDKITIKKNYQSCLNYSYFSTQKIRPKGKSCSEIPSQPYFPPLNGPVKIVSTSRSIYRSKQNRRRKSVYLCSQNSPSYSYMEESSRIVSVEQIQTQKFSSEHNLQTQISEINSLQSNSTQNCPNQVNEGDISPQEQIFTIIERLRGTQDTPLPPWTEITSFSFPIDILFSKLQIFEAALQIKTGNSFIGCQILTESLENSPRYLPSDRLLSLQMLEFALKDYKEEKGCLTKHIRKFNHTKLNISVILNLRSNLNKMCQNLYELHQLSNTFGLVAVNERVEQCVIRNNQQCFKGKKNFLDYIFKYLRKKVISTEPYHFHSAITKGSAQFQQCKNHPEREDMKNYLLIIANLNFSLKNEHFSHKIFTQLKQDKVKILILLSNIDNQSVAMNILQLELPFKIRFFFQFDHVIDYLNKKSLKFVTSQPILIEKI